MYSVLLQRLYRSFNDKNQYFFKLIYDSLVNSFPLLLSIRCLTDVFIKIVYDHLYTSVFLYALEYFIGWSLSKSQRMDHFLVPVAKSLPKRLCHKILKIDDLLDIVLIHVYLVYNEIENFSSFLFLFLFLFFTLIAGYLAKRSLVLIA